jgi:ribosomal protein S18 acetylase RimI-like enzyme
VERLRRLSFRPDAADDVVAFCVPNGSRYDAGLVRRLLLQMTSDPSGVFVLADDEGPALVATVIDRTQNGPNAANLEILGARGPMPAATFSRLVLEPAVAFARAGVRTALHVDLHACLSRVQGAEPALREAGFAHLHDSFSMRRPADAAPPDPPPPLPAGWRWDPLDAPRVEAAHAALMETFRHSAGTNLAPLPEFRQWVASRATLWRVLLDGESVAGLVQVAPHGIRGEVRTLGRLPRYRGQGLGQRLLAEAVRLLGESGAWELELEVEARNEQALVLYRRFGFAVAARTATLALKL